MKILAAGPWIGEFGWELFEWQSFIRSKSIKYDKVIVSSRPGHEVIYRDFCDLFIPNEADVNDCCGWTNFQDGKSHPVFRDIEYTDLIQPNSYLKGKQSFIQYGSDDPLMDYDIVIHARNVQTSSKYKKEKYEKKSFRNWNEKKWETLSESFKKDNLRVCSIGTSDSAYHIKGTDDKRNISLNILADILRSSKLCVGPSSGPMHFASLCGCPHFVWTAKKNIEKYQTKWNPLGTKVWLHIDESWDPCVRVITNEIKKVYIGTI